MKAIARAWFNGALLLILMLWIFGSSVSYSFYKCKVLRRRVQSDMSISIGTACARLLFLIAPHVKLRFIPSHGVENRWQLLLDVCAWFPQLGERSIGRVDVPLPDADSPSVRLKLQAPLEIELHWRAYGAPASPDKAAWEAEAEPLDHPYGGGEW